MKQKRLTSGALSIALAATMFSTTAFAVSVEFTDVLDSHWASSSITKMTDKGIMSDTGNNLFTPSNTLTGAELVTMIVRHFYEDKLGTEGEKWCSEFMDAARSTNTLIGTNVTAGDTINRYDMTQLMYNVLKAEGTTTSSLSDTSKVADWVSAPFIYRDAVSVCYNMDMLTGVDNKGTFNGTGVMDRAQAAVVMGRLLEIYFDGTPSTPEKPAGSLTLTSGNVLYIRDDGPKYENGVFYLYNSGFKGTGGWIYFDNTGYSTLMLTVSVHDVGHRVTVSSADSMISNDQRLNAIQDLDTTKTCSVNISGIERVTIGVNYGRTCDAEVFNIYLS